MSALLALGVAGALAAAAAARGPGARAVEPDVFPFVFGIRTVRGRRAFLVPPEVYRALGNADRDPTHLLVFGWLGPDRGRAIGIGEPGGYVNEAIMDGRTYSGSWIFEPDVTDGRRVKHFCGFQVAEMEFRIPRLGDVDYPGDR